MRAWSSLGAALLLVVTAADTAAQGRRGHRGGETAIELAFLAAEPTGEFARNVEEGFGAELGLRHALDPAGLISLRADIGFINYGHERFRVCSLISCRVNLDLTTRNNIFSFGMGPELALPLGIIRPYAGAAFGVAYFVTTSGYSGSANHEDFASTTNFDDAVFQWQGRTGLQIRVSNGRHPVHLDFGTTYQRNGVTEYLREGDIVDRPDGSIVIRPNRTEANLWTMRLGVSIGVGGRR